jgi:hypothetical protein
MVSFALENNPTRRDFTVQTPDFARYRANQTGALTCRTFSNTLKSTVRLAAVGQGRRKTGEVG